MIDNSSIVHPDAKIGKNVSIGPFCVIGKNVTIQSNSKIYSNVFIDGHTFIDENAEIFPFSSIGTKPQDLKFDGELSYIKIGKNLKIREYVTINPGTRGGGGLTFIDDNCLLMVGTHIAHDCKVGKNVIFANNATLAGHVEVQDNAVIGGLSAIHQFVRIGEGAMVGGMSGVTADVIPFGSVIGNRAKLAGLNLIGLKRQNVDKEELIKLRKFYKDIFENKDENFKDRIRKIDKDILKYNLIKKIVEFLKIDTSRSFCLPD